MWLARSEVADLYLSGRQLATRVAGNLVHLQPGDDVASSVQAAVSPWPGRRWRLWLGGHRCALHLCEPIPGIRSIEEAETALAASLGDGSAPGAVRLATWSSAPRPWLAMVSEAGLMERLMEAVEVGAGAVQSIRPWWASIREGELRSVAMCDDEAVTYWRQNDQGVFTAAATLWVPSEQQAATLQRLQIAGSLSANRLNLHAVASGGVGFAASRLNEG